MRNAKLLIATSLFAFVIVSCVRSTPQVYRIPDSKDYEASLFRQHCAICHGPNGEGKKLEDGTVVPSLREGQFKFRSEAEIYKQIAAGGNGMTPFRDQLTQHELDLMAKFVHDKLRQPVIK